MSKEQIILGINGYSRRVHDASACIVVNGNLVAMAEEERFTRRKKAFGEVPHNAIAFCLDRAGITVDQVDSIAIGWNFDKVFGNIGAKPPTRDELIDLYLPSDRFKYSKRPELEMVSHHLAHAASAYYLSGFPESLVLVIDGQGETQSTSVFTAKGKGVSLIREFGVTDSLGFFYEAVSEYVGLSRLDVGKTMGLASYGSPIYEFGLFRLVEGGYSVDLIPPAQREMDLQQEVTRLWRDYLEGKFGPANRVDLAYDSTRARFKREVSFGDTYKNVTASAQKALEDVVRHLITLYAAEYQMKNLCIAGGVGLNCSMNGVIARDGIVADFFVPPFSNDAGVSVGAALYLSDQKPTTRLESASLGPEFSNDAIVTTLKSLGIDYRSVDDIGSYVAKLLAEDKIVDWFQGKMEAGPRALGNRSILGNPTNRATHHRLNEIKNREPWRPLAPSFLAEDLANYMQDSSDSPFMLRAFLTRPNKVSEIPAAVHIDGTSRAQTVTERTSPLYYRLIKDFKHISGIPAVMNTSFNLEYEPIVCSPHDAIRTFYSSSADYLAIGDALISKR
ncbi:hypothetical protein HYS96_03675 [Candidatus Daviesbacteria bacterium]|nr:hypothetical protein [Candidatus Daviesbacteria bacterium]